MNDDQGKLAGALALARVEEIQVDLTELAQPNDHSFTVLLQPRGIAPNQQELPLLKGEVRLAALPGPASPLELFTEKKVVELIEYLVLSLLLFQGQLAEEALESHRHFLEFIHVYNTIIKVLTLMVTTNASAGFMLVVRRAIVPYATGMGLMMALPEERFN